MSDVLVFLINFAVLIPLILCRPSKRIFVGYSRFSKKDNLCLESLKYSESSEQLLALKSCQYGMEVLQDLEWLRWVQKVVLRIGGLKM